MSLLGNLTVGILGNMDNLSGTLNGAAGQVQQFGRDMSRAGMEIAGVGAALTTFVSAPLAALGKVAMDSSIQYESAFAGVRKTTDMTEEQYASMSRAMRDMALEIPAAATEIARVGEAAGQLGIENEAILGFTRVMVDLGVASDLSSDQAAMALARFATITGMAQSDFDRLGSTIVDLGNNFAATESEITEMGLRLAGAGAQIGMSEAEILALSTALTSVGIRAEAGGSAFSRVMINMASAVDEGGDQLENFARVSGVTTSEFKKAFEEDAAGAMHSFVAGLGNLSDESESTFAVLDEMGLSEIRVRDALLRTSGAADTMSSALGIATNAWEENTALTDEAAERYGTAESQFQIIKNAFIDIAITLGDIVVPIILEFIGMAQPLIDMLRDMVDWFAQLDPTIQKIAVAVGLVLAAIGPFLTVVGLVIAALGAAISGAITLAPVIGGVGAAFAGLIGPIAIAIGIIAAVVAIGVTLYKNWDKIKGVAAGVFSSFASLLEPMKDAFTKLKDSIEPIWENLKELFKSLEPILLSVAAIVGGVLVTGFGIAISIFNGVVAAIGPLINALISLADMFINVFNAIVRLIVGDFSGAMEYWNQATESSLAFIMSLWDGVVAFFSTFIQSIVDFFYGLYMTLVGNSIIPDMVREIIQWFQDLWTWAVELVAGLVAGVVEWFQNLWTSVVEKFTGLKDAIVEIWNNIQLAFTEVLTFLDDLTGGRFSAIFSTVQSYMDLVSGIISDVWQYVRGTFSNVLAFLKGLVTGDFSAMKNAIDSQMQNARDLISRIWGRIKSFFSEVLENIVSTVKEKFEEQVQAVKEKMEAAKDKIEEIWNTAVEFLQGIDLFSIGSDIIDGLISGIGSMATAVWGKVTEIGNGIKDTLLGVLDINSPSRVAIWISEMFGDGLVIGLSDAVKGVLSASADLAKAIIPDVPEFELPGMAMPDVSNDMATLNGSNGGAILGDTFDFADQFRGANFYIRDDQDIPRLARELNRHNGSSGRRRGSM